ncbi:MAG: acyl-CoA dehydrogenase family protein [Arenicellales bacterium]|jgi:alkylation response protein AidB-like acyl-CoA dehydrogenase|uniref:Acyl-CoA dehydrogenase n=1 Tax=marine metagenome TaxID=408172 RepID=A0A381TKE3_9ZZZZ|nr:acyl-CoA dehydrogenase [Acidiferrobacteraceae bacterium]MDP6134872.1 acyl-CoA dehydrogenase family protein [Arenicellales bacterium]HCF73570.1 acyl-CoA dehydrogenase [Gammaproteobacteria bacterium]MDP6391637.1 acyl-CoA dehydrogenase family protein [Arenicellales bacterium]MDP7220698.1 acyl-CoA dehydrogenase family protein [Arenicellales bacterium]|tara:strand:+ start:8579 stop:9739 length:1161 start_codon:yes stop_codon:yes gene_type:complete
MEFSLSVEQKMLIDSARHFTEQVLYPSEDEVEASDQVSPELKAWVVDKAIEHGFYAANMPEELGGGGLDTVSLTLFERELGRANFALQYLVGRPSNILQACTGEQRERYLLPCIRGEKIDCLAMTEPAAGSDLRSMICRADVDGNEYVINGTKHFISHADIADFVILFAATGEEATSRGVKKLISAFLVDKGTTGFTVRPGYHSVSHRGYHNSILEFDHCRVPASQMLGEKDQGFQVANDWLGATRLQVAAMCLGRAHRALELANQWAAQRQQFGQPVGRFQGVGFKLADMKMRLEAAELLTLQAAWKTDQGTATDTDYAMAKLYSTEMLAFVADEAIQIHGGMGLMADLPLERIWRDARVERIWEGTSEIQRHIISRDILRPHWT